VVRQQNIRNRVSHAGFENGVAERVFLPWVAIEIVERGPGFGSNRFTKSRSV